MKKICLATLFLWASLFQAPYGYATSYFCATDTVIYGQSENLFLGTIVSAEKVPDVPPDSYGSVLRRVDVRVDKVYKGLNSVTSDQVTIHHWVDRFGDFMGRAKSGDTLLFDVERHQDDGLFYTRICGCKAADKVNNNVLDQYFASPETGIIKFYYPDGTLKASFEHQNGVPKGLFKTYDKQGQLIRTKTLDGDTWEVKDL